LDQDCGVTLAGARAGVERMLSEGESFRSIEHAIDATALDDERKAALWLLAWSQRPRDGQRHGARASVDLISA
jgi:hypothetical protein